MFLCRPLPRQLCLVKRVNSSFLPQKFFRSLSQAAEQNNNAYTKINTTLNSSSHSANTSSPSLSSHPWFRHHLPKYSARSNETGGILGEYITMRRDSPDRVGDIPIDLFQRLIQRAYESKMPHVLNSLSEDLLKFFPGRKALVQQILTTGDYHYLSGSRVLDLLRCLGQPLDLSRDELAYLTNRVCRLKSSNVDDKLTDIVLLPMLQHLESTDTVPSGARSVTHSVPVEVYAAFELLFKLAKLGNRTGTLSLFRLLVDKLYIPPEAIQRAPTSSQDFAWIVSVTLARACIHWQRRGLGFFIVSDLLLSHSSQDSTPSDIATELGDLVSDMLYASLNEPTRKDFDTCVGLICQAHSISPVQNGIIRLAYNCAHQSNYAVSARRLYAFTRSPSVLETHDYPAPQSSVLLWLLRLLTSAKGSTELARMVAEEVAASGILLPVHDRADFISITAVHGFAMSARTLWQRYSVGRDRHVVVGSSKVMLKMVKLFHHLWRRVDAEISRRQGKGLLDDTILKERHDDLAAFANHVLSSYREYHEPLEKMQHQNLTSLARAYFVLGEFKKGFQIFRVLLGRREIPDMYDINAALSALSEYSPRTVARLIERMTEKGLYPDKVTFGTVVHQALLADDMELVGDLISRAKELGVTELSPHTFVSLIRASVTDDAKVTKSSPRARLQAAMKMVKSLRKVGMISSPHIGKYMVYASLRLKEPIMAYEFWNLLLRQSTNWTDREQVFIRRLIRQGLQAPQGSSRRGRQRARLKEETMTEQVLLRLKSRPAVKELE
ncbi:hypothetical protein K435DRAFT_116835 [Dendrothele bispora CBS 962.96]|uniref:Pentacotripeptide-repeat region of PRORP domain-containing protein n=1 Tax=Dendrothele bispora (strain CBS 962.96) TaxID=1314807 RepID=A0A4S8MQ93_DENBC|nr:hypothetical protein K435DRAFT_116835 [Dendrothele bispora CBS 962.96]